MQTLWGGGDIMGSNSFYSDLDSIHQTRFYCLLCALVEELRLDVEANDDHPATIDDLFDRASTEIFTLDERADIISKAIGILKKKYKLNVISTNPLVVEKI